MRGKVLSLALLGAIIALPVPASQLLAGTFSGSAGAIGGRAPAAFGPLIADPFLTDRLRFTPARTASEAAAP